MMQPEVNFCYYSFKLKESLQIISIKNGKIIMRGFDSGKMFPTDHQEMQEGILANRLKEHTKQNEYLKIIKSLNK